MNARNVRSSRRVAPSPRRQAPSSGARAQNRAPRAARLEKQKKIVLEAERLFARFGFEGVSLDDIATALGISRQNMLYYYASKEALYLAVLDDVMESWVGSMDLLTRKNDPEAAIRAYIGAKLKFSRERPSGSAVFTREVMAGAPLYGEQLAARVNPKLRADVRAFERWARQGLIERLNFTHLMFFIWSVTQSYADLGPQFALLMGKRRLGERDFAAAQELLCQLILSSLRPQAFPEKETP
jgi:TetR/AcrR family transcriptional regulator